MTAWANNQPQRHENVARIAKRKGRILKHIRLEFVLTQGELATKLGVARETICRWELGQQQVPYLVMMGAVAMLYKERRCAW